MSNDYYLYSEATRDTHERFSMSLSKATPWLILTVALVLMLVTIATLGVMRWSTKPGVARQTSKQAY